MKNIGFHHVIENTCSFGKNIINHLSKSVIELAFRTDCDYFFDALTKEITSLSLN